METATGMGGMTMTRKTIDRIQLGFGMFILLAAFVLLLFGCQSKIQQAQAIEAAPPANLAAEPKRLDRTTGTNVLLERQDAPMSEDVRKRASGPMVFSGSTPATVPASTPANTAWYFDKQFCGLTHPLAWNEFPILAIDCTVNYVAGSATPSDKRFPPAPIMLDSKQIGTVCGFIDKQRKVDHFSCVLIFQQ